MSTVFVECWRCDECGHRWIKGETWPSHCASSKCRKRSWNKLGAGFGSTGIVSSNDPRDRETAVDAKEGLKPRQPSNPAPKMNDKMAEFFAKLKPMAIEPDVVDEFPGCRHKERIEETGETYGCSREMGHRGNCSRGERIDE